MQTGGQDFNSAIYVFLSYPDYKSLSKYEDYLKINPKDYIIQGDKSRELFSIYTHEDPDWPDCYIGFDEL